MNNNIQSLDIFWKFGHSHESYLFPKTIRIWLELMHHTHIIKDFFPKEEAPSVQLAIGNDSWRWELILRILHVSCVYYTPS